MDRRDLACWNCGELAVNEPLPLSRHAACQHCFEMLHCCVMCRHFDPSSRPTCQHDLADPPRESDSANFCDYLSPHFGRDRSSRRQGNGAAASLAQLFAEAMEMKSRHSPSCALPDSNTSGRRRGGWMGGDMAPTDANPAFAPLNANLGAWTRCWGLGLAFWGLD